MQLLVSLSIACHSVSVAHAARYASPSDECCDTVELLWCGLEQSWGGCLAVDGVYHDLLRRDVGNGVEPWQHVVVAGVVGTLAGHVSLHEHGLYDDVSVERLHALYRPCHVVSALRMVGQADVFCRDGVELQYVVVDEHQRVADRLPVNQRGVAQHTHLSLRAVAVAQGNGVGYNLREVRVARGLAVAGEGEDVGQAALMLHLLQLALQCGGHGVARGKGQQRAVLLVEAALAVHAVEGAHLAVGRQEVDAQRQTQAAAVDRPEDGRGIDNGTHNRVQR